MVAHLFEYLQCDLLVDYVVFGQEDADLLLALFRHCMPGDDFLWRPFSRGLSADRDYEAVKKTGLFYRFDQVYRESRLFEPSGVAARTERGHHHEHGIGQGRIALDHSAKGLSVGLRHLHVKDGDAERVS